MMADELVPMYQYLAKIAASFLPADNPERLWAEWLAANHDRLHTATVELGVTVAEGPDFIDRLKAAVIPKLLEQHEPR
jgi:hypothetical protein